MQAAHKLEKSKVLRMSLNSDLSSKLDYYLRNKRLRHLKSACRRGAWPPAASRCRQQRHAPPRRSCAKPVESSRVECSGASDGKIHVIYALFGSKNTRERGLLDFSSSFLHHTHDDEELTRLLGACSDKFSFGSSVKPSFGSEFHKSSARQLTYPRI